MNIIDQYRAKLHCKMFGHKRGKRTGVSSIHGIQFQCARCGAVWNRKVKA
jgi:hypothetical protein